MNTYFGFIRLTSQGTKNFKRGPEWIGQAREKFSEMGANLREFYSVMNGNFQGVCIMEAPDDETIMKLTMQLVSKGEYTVEVSRALTETEYLHVIDSMR